MCAPGIRRVVHDVRGCCCESVLETRGRELEVPEQAEKGADVVTSGTTGKTSTGQQE